MTETEAKIEAIFKAVQDYKPGPIVIPCSAETFNYYVTNDKQLVIERILQGYRVKAVDYIRQSIEGTGKDVRVIDYGKGGMLLSY